MLAPDATSALARLGGSAPVRDLDDLCGRAAVRRAVQRGEIRRIARGRYALPEAPDPRLAAVRLAGVVSHQSAARLWGIELLEDDGRPHVTVPPTRGRLDRRGAAIHWSELGRHEIRSAVTAPLRTVLDVSRTSAFAQGLACADSALRQGLVRAADLRSAAEVLAGHGSRTARLVAAHADGRAESVLESALRALLIQARIEGFVPQLQIDEDGFRGRVDLGDPVRRIVLEADSFAHHGHRAALTRDCHRYTELTIRGWRVLRFAWEHVMFEPGWVQRCITVATTGRTAP